MIFSDNYSLSFSLESENDSTLLQIDGENKFNLQQNDVINIQKAKEKISFIKLTNKTFFQILRKKLHMGKNSFLMIKHLIMKNFIIIEDLKLEFNSGLNVLTGETGVGKSIIMGALNLLMGEPLKSNVIYPKAEKAYWKLI